MFNKKSIIELKKDLNNECFSRKTCSFYKYIKIENRKALRNILYKHLSELKVFGRIYLAKEGINAQISIPEHNIDEFEKFISPFFSFTNSIFICFSTYLDIFYFFKTTKRILFKTSAITS